MSSRWYLVAGALWLSGCAFALKANQAALRGDVARGDYRQAMVHLEGAKGSAYAQRDSVLYGLNQGLILHHLGEYEKSNEAFHQADEAAEDLYTKSVSAIAASALTNAMARPYEPEDFERILSYVYSAFNYLALGQLSEALVEIRRANDKLAYFNTRSKQKNAYNQDAFAHWLAGVLFEEERSYQEALVSYRLALKAYDDYARLYGFEPPSFLGEDLVRAARLAGQADLVPGFRAKFPQATGATFDALKNEGELVVIGSTGLIPAKRELVVTCAANPDLPIPLCDFGLFSDVWQRTPLVLAPGVDVIKVAFPTIERPPPSGRRLVMRVEQAVVEGQVVEDLVGIAEKCVDDRRGREYAEAIGRAIAKYLAQKGAAALAERKSPGLGRWVNLAGSIINQSTEAADIRSWFVLPESFSVARMWLAPRDYDVVLEVQDASGAVRSRESRRVSVARGKRIFVTFREGA